MSPPPFLVNVAGLRRTPGARRSEQRRGPIDGLQVTSTHVPAGAEVDTDLILEVIDGGMVAIGTVSAPWVGECRRCLQPVEGVLRVELREIYEPRPAGPAGTEAELEEETYPLTGDTLDLRPLARDAVLLNLPQAPLCRPDCAGLCPTCGVDLNAGPCGCPPVATDVRWAALDVLRPTETS
jgi:uncharacterized protein